MCAKLELNIFLDLLTQVEIKKGFWEDVWEDI